MPYVSRDLLRLSLEALGKDYSPLLIVSLPCMLAKRIPTCKTIAEARNSSIAFGSGDEEKWLEQYYNVHGGPSGKRYYMPGTKQWVQPAYAGKSLQRRRKDYDGTVFHHPDDSRWALRPDAAVVIKEKILGQKKQPAVPIAALMCWMWRHKDMPELEQGLDDFIKTIGFDRDNLINSVFSPEIPAAFMDAGLSLEKISDKTVAELVGAATPPPVAPDLETAVKAIEEVLTKNHYIFAPGLIHRIIGGWIVGDIVVLVGPTGSGKTALAVCMGKALQNLFGEDRFLQAFLEVTPDYDAAQFMGYENLSGLFTAGRFAKEVLFVGEPTDPRLVVLDEWNLSQIDAYFAPVLSTVESRRPMQLPGRIDLDALGVESSEELRRAQPSITDGQWILPEDVFFLATCNSWSDEPETRLPISGPVKRRCRIIQMPNILEMRYRESQREGIYQVCDVLLAQERESVETRASNAEPSVWDKYRSSRLQAIPTARALQERTHQTLARICAVLLEDAQTRPLFTIGILRDVLLSCVYAPQGNDFDALGQEIVDKVLHQLRGSPRVLEIVTDLSREFINSAEIKALATRMGAFAGEKRIQPLL